MRHSILEGMLRSENTQAALNSAKQFCEFIDSLSVHDYSQDTFLDLLHLRLTDLYSTSIQVPKVELVVSDSEIEKETKSTDAALHKKLSELLGEYIDYSQAFDPTILDDKENYANGWLVDDIRWSGEN